MGQCRCKDVDAPQLNTAGVKAWLRDDIEEQ